MASSNRTSTGGHHSHAEAPPPPTPGRYPLAGGFVRPTTSLPSPAPSTASSRAAARLPHPRSRPLPPGSRKEDYARDYVSQRLMHISRRYVKKHGIPDPADQVTGYESMDQVCVDMEEVVDVLWFSGTPSIQVPTLLALALALTEYLPSFSPAPRPTFSLLQKLDHCFASLLVGQDVKTNEMLPGFQRGPSAGFSRTDMVRIKSLADETRMLVAVVMSGEADVEDVEEDDDETGANIMTTGPSANTFCQDLDLDKTAASKTTSPAGDHMANDDGDLEIIDDTIPSGNTKREQDSDDYDEEEGEEFVDVEPPTNKRKLSKRQELEAAAVDAAPNVMTDQELADEAKKRIKMEDSDSADILSYSPAHNITAPARPAATIGDTRSSPAQDYDKSMDTDTCAEPRAETPADHQFHWMVEDSDTDSDDGQSKQTNSLHIGQPPQGSLSSTSSLRLQAQVQQRIPEDMEEDGEDAEEELHLNVAKVYARTLTQLGEILGETIIDE